MARVVALSGAHGTGKSTLVEELSKDPRCICIDSVTRTNTTQAERRIDGVEDLDQTQLSILKAIGEKVREIRELKRTLPDDKIIVLDRSYVDFYAYCKNFLVKNLIRHKTFEFVELKFYDLTRYIDCFFYLPIQFNIVDDGVRSLDTDLQQGVDRVIREQLFKVGRTVELTGTVKDRLGRINRTLDILNEKHTIYGL